MKKATKDLRDVEEWARGNLRNDAATALHEDRPWTYPPPWRLLRRSGAVTFPYPHTITDAAQAERWAAVAQDLAAGIKDFAAILLVVAGAMLSLSFLGLGVGLSISIAGSMSPGAEIASKISLGVTVVATIAFVAALLPVPRAAVWERRAVALRARAVELASEFAAPGEASGQCQRWHWPWPRGHHG